MELWKHHEAACRAVIDNAGASAELKSLAKALVFTGNAIESLADQTRKCLEVYRALSDLVCQIERSLPHEQQAFEAIKSALRRATIPAFVTNPTSEEIPHHFTPPPSRDY